MAGWPSRRVRQSQVQNWHAWKEEEEKSWPATIRQEMMKNVYYHHHNKKMEKRKKTDRGKRQRRTLHFIPFFTHFGLDDNIPAPPQNKNGSHVRNCKMGRCIYDVVRLRSKWNSLLQFSTFKWRGGYCYHYTFFSSPFLFVFFLRQSCYQSSEENCTPEKR